MLRTFSGLALALVLLVGTVSGQVSTASALQGESSGSKPGCEVTSRSKALVVLVCRANLDDASLVKAGKEACGARMPCNAWIWDDAAKAPEKAPAKDADMPKEAARAAIGIWANDEQVLVRLRPARRSGAPARTLPAQPQPLANFSPWGATVPADSTRPIP